MYLYVMNNEVISKKWAKENKVAIVTQALEGNCLVAMENENDELLQEKLRLELNCKIVPRKSTIGEIRQLQNPLFLADENMADSLIQEIEQAQSTSWESEPIISLVDSLIEEALEQNATDIHFEPQGKKLRIRFRQDGLLNDFKTLPIGISDAILVRLKILSSVDITDKRIPHDGSFIFNGFKHQANIRMSTLPIQGTSQSLEKCVLRLLPLSEDEMDNRKIGLDYLNFNLSEINFLRKIFNSPQGIFLITGPTGRGKTTTLHAGLQEIIGRQINITTIEDPVEYVLPGANQVQINEKCDLTFANALRSILRQDPDVILVGEIRDKETAQIALHAAQTGHLVLSTLHTNSAQAAYSRLNDLGIEHSALKESLLGIMAQRLIRIKEGEIYKGRQAIIEILKPDGQYVNGTLRDAAHQLLSKKMTDLAEIERVIGTISAL